MQLSIVHCAENTGAANAIDDVLSRRASYLACSSDRISVQTTRTHALAIDYLFVDGAEVADAVRIS